MSATSFGAAGSAFARNYRRRGTDGPVSVAPLPHDDDGGQPQSTHTRAACPGVTRVRRPGLFFASPWIDEVDRIYRRRGLAVDVVSRRWADRSQRRRAPEAVPIAEPVSISDAVTVAVARTAGDLYLLGPGDGRPRPTCRRRESSRRARFRVHRHNRPL